MRRAFRERTDELAKREHQAEAQLAEMRAAIERLRREREARIGEFSELTRPAAPQAAPAIDGAQNDAVPGVAGVGGPTDAAWPPDDGSATDPLAAASADSPAATPSAPWPPPASPPAERPGATWTPARVLAAAVVSGLVLGAMVAWLWAWIERSPAPTPTAAATPAADRAGMGTTQTPERAGEPPAPAQGAAPALSVELSVSRQAWLRASADGRTLVNRTARAGEHLTLSGSGPIEIRFGDAGAVRVRVNGEDRGLAGRDGQVLTTRFSRAGQVEP